MSLCKVCMTPASRRGASEYDDSGVSFAAAEPASFPQEHALCKTIQREIDALRAEVHVLRRKGGQVYTPQA
jgi:hypothetical protein